MEEVEVNIIVDRVVAILEIFGGRLYRGVRLCLDLRLERNSNYTTFMGFILGVTKAVNSNSQVS